MSRCCLLLAALLWAVACAEPAPELPSAGEASPHAGWPEPLVELVDEAAERFGVPTLDAASAAERLAGATLVDVRNADEYAVSHVPGARPLVDEAARAAFLAAPPEGPVLVVCTAGWRSAEFTGYLVRAGLDAFNVEGGVCAWAAAGQPLVDASGEPTTRIHAFSDAFVDCVPAGFEAVTP